MDVLSRRVCTNRTSYRVVPRVEWLQHTCDDEDCNRRQMVESPGDPVMSPGNHLVLNKQEPGSRLGVVSKCTEGSCCYNDECCGPLPRFCLESLLISSKCTGTGYLVCFDEGI